MMKPLKVSRDGIMHVPANQLGAGSVGRKCPVIVAEVLPFLAQCVVEHHRAVHVGADSSNRCHELGSMIAVRGLAT